jgi:hypothetical protein
MAALRQDARVWECVTGGAVVAPEPKMFLVDGAALWL